jgi:hypothetical protein
MPHFLFLKQTGLFALQFHNTAVAVAPVMIVG